VGDRPGALGSGRSVAPPTGVGDGCNLGVIAGVPATLAAVCVAAAGTALAVGGAVAGVVVGRRSASAVDVLAKG